MSQVPEGWTGPSSQPPTGKRKLWRVPSLPVQLPARNSPGAVCKTPSRQQKLISRGAPIHVAARATRLLENFFQKTGVYLYSFSAPRAQGEKGSEASAT